ncbi:enolase C-terminal domain-like protein [Streptomyces sp. CSDS2]|uniref:enolase C-terminal domain-like protein n=1 Tax=Streptomyces sp. CSDS2 TaxID=3055051 RepID=UPI0025B16931|nr:enolase C-terminal domain-like protein [Streptomyces sp. CSDS2]MDN3264011.1 enolase C-terminal domain-like protein [Streptomyces sp. CSDS2]
MTSEPTVTPAAVAEAASSAVPPAPAARPSPAGRGTRDERVTAVRLHTVAVTRRTTWLLAEVRGSDGTTGWGELSDLPGGDPAAPLSELAAGITGTTWGRAVTWLDTHGQRWADAPAGATARLTRRTVLGGLATAVADAAARRAALPLGHWIRRAAAPPPAPAGPPDRAAPPPSPACAAPPAGAPRVALYANINRAMTTRTPQAAARLAARAVAAGFRAVKCAPFDGLPAGDRVGAGLEIARAVRDAVGTEVDVLLDAHHLVTVADILSRSEAFAALRPGWLEDAAPLDDVTGLRRLRDALGVPLAGGEFTGREQEVLPALRGGVLDVLLPDVKHAGGPLPALRLARLARRYGADVSFHNPSGPVATAAAAHLTLLAGSALPLEVMFGERNGPAGRDTPPYFLVDGAYVLPSGPGLGLAPLPAPQVLSADGGVTP